MYPNSCSHILSQDTEPQKNKRKASSVFHTWAQNSQLLLKPIFTVWSKRESQVQRPSSKQDGCLKTRLKAKLRGVESS